MQKIVIMSRGEKSEEGFVRLVETLFPECEICIASAMETDDKSPGHSTPPMAKIRKESLIPRQKDDMDGKTRQEE